MLGPQCWSYAISSLHHDVQQIRRRLTQCYEIASKPWRLCKVNMLEARSVEISGDLRARTHRYPSLCMRLASSEMTTPTSSTFKRSPGAAMCYPCPSERHPAQALQKIQSFRASRALFTTVFKTRTKHKASATWDLFILRRAKQFFPSYRDQYIFLLPCGTTYCSEARYRGIEIATRRFIRAQNSSSLVHAQVFG